MPITPQIRETQGILTMDGKFDFNSHREFRVAYEPLVTDANLRLITLDFTKVPYLDSSALGMLLLLKEKAIAANKSVEIVNCQPTVKQVFEIACFHTMFTIR